MKRAIALTLCLAALAFFAASCQTAQKCPAYAHYSKNIEYGILNME